MRATRESAMHAAWSRRASMAVVMAPDAPISGEPAMQGRRSSLRAKKKQKEEEL
jgi:hypothetical protein